MANTQTFSSVSAAQWTKICAALAENGLVVVGNSGDIQKMGVHATFEFQEPILTVTVLSAPPFMMGVVEKKIRDGIQPFL